MSLENTLREMLNENYVPYVNPETGRPNIRPGDTVFGRAISPRKAAAVALTAALTASGVGDQLRAQANLAQAREAGKRAARDVESAYTGLQNVARSAQQVPELAPGAEAAKKPKPRRRLEETLVEYYKQRLEEAIRNT